MSRTRKDSRRRKNPEYYCATFGVEELDTCRYYHIQVLMKANSKAEALAVAKKAAYSRCNNPESKEHEYHVHCWADNSMRVDVLPEFIAPVSKQNFTYLKKLMIEVLRTPEFNNHEKISFEAEEE